MDIQLRLPTTEKELFDFYISTLPLYYDAEANNVLPTELLLEFHAAFNHLSRFHIGSSTLEDSLQSAYGHLKRATLDGFKLKYIHCAEDCEVLVKNSKSLKYLDNGRFLPALLGEYSSLKRRATKARTLEGCGKTEEAISAWIEVSLLVDAFKEKYFNEEKRVWAEQKHKRVVSKETVVAFIIGLLTSGIASIAINILM